MEKGKALFQQDVYKGTVSLNANDGFVIDTFLYHKGVVFYCFAGTSRAHAPPQARVSMRVWTGSPAASLLHKQSARHGWLSSLQEGDSW